MAEIYLARTASIEGFEKTVVLKRILPQYSENARFIRMFLAEARLAANLHDPNIVQVYDIGEEHGAYFFTMEYVEGVDLRGLARACRRTNTPLSLAHIVHIVSSAAAGLHHAHEKCGPDGEPLGIVHRDVSPSNILVTFEGVVKILDFGIAKAANVTTTAGSLKGKLPYMSPEQCRSEPLDRRSDVFSLGVLLWELTTRRRLFKADTELATLRMVAECEVPRPSTLMPDYPEGLEPIVLKALEADRERRYGSMLELQLDLEDLAREARLAIGASRMRPFMHKVCAEEINDLEAQRIADHAIGTSGGGVTGFTEAPAPSPAQSTQLSPEESSSELTPADLDGSKSVTSIAPLPSPSPNRRYAIGLGALGAVLAVSTWAFVLRPDAESTGGSQRPTTKASAPAAVPAPAESEPEPEPNAEAPVAAPSEAEAPADAVEPEPPSEPTPAAEPAADATEEAADAPEVADEPEAAAPPKSSSRRRRPKRSTPRTGSGKSSDTPKESKPKWDPKAAPPPGL